MENKRHISFAILFSLILSLFVPGCTVSGNEDNTPGSADSTGVTVMAATSGNPDLSDAGVPEPSAAGKSDPSAAGKSDSSAAGKSDSSVAGNPDPSVPVTSGTFRPEAFEGKIRHMAYGGGSSVLVLSDLLYLYDTETGKVTASAPCPPMSTVKLQPYQGGYAILGNESDAPPSGGSGMSMEASGRYLAVIYDGDLKETGRIDISGTLSKGDFIVSEDNLALSPDGKWLAIVSMNALKLFETDKGVLTELIDFKDGPADNGWSIIGINQIEFIAGGGRLAFAGMSFPANQAKIQESLNTYGTIGVDGSGFCNFRRDDYSVGYGLLACDDLLLLPENFTKAEGKVLAHTVSTGEETVYPLSVSGEGRDGVFLSEQGRYFASAQLKDGLTVRIYEQDGGRLVREETISGGDELYFARIPEILLLDDTRTCLVLMGTRQNGLDTRSACFGF